MGFFLVITNWAKFWADTKTTLKKIFVNYHDFNVDLILLKAPRNNSKTLHVTKSKKLHHWTSQNKLVAAWLNRENKTAFWWEIARIIGRWKIHIKVYKVNIGWWLGLRSHDYWERVHEWNMFCDAEGRRSRWDANSSRWSSGVVLALIEMCCDLPYMSVYDLGGFLKDRLATGISWCCCIISLPRWQSAGKLLRIHDICISVNSCMDIS